MDEAMIRHIGMLTKRLGASKKTVLENVFRYYPEKIEAEQGFDVLTYAYSASGENKYQSSPF
jgi:hypothetical protein